MCAFGGISYGFVRACLITGWFDVFLAYWAFACASFLAAPVNYLARDFDLARHDALVSAWRPLRYPSVDVWLPNCGEWLGYFATPGTISLA